MAAQIALALGSGGARGYAHIGVIRELEDRGHQIVSIAGSSMGAVVGGVCASGRLEEFTEWVLTLSQRGVVRQLDPSPGKGGMIRAERVVAQMVELMGDRRIEDLSTPFTAVAVDLLAGREVWLNEGPLDRAIRASIGIPGVITPTMVNGRLLVDGGVLNPVPVAATAASRADTVVAVSLQGQRGPHPGATPTSDTADRRPAPEWWERFMSNAAAQAPGSETIAALVQRLSAQRPGHSGERPDGGAESEPSPSLNMSEVMTLSLEAAQAALTRYSLAAHAPDILITVPKDVCRTFDFHMAADLIPLGRELASRALDAAEL